MGKKYKLLHKKQGKVLKKGEELDADELSLSRSAGKPGCYRMLQCLGFLLTLMGVNFAVMRDDLRMAAREQECMECNSTDPTEEERLQSAFNRLDQNGDGVLSRGEIQQESSKLLDQPLTPSGLDATMTEMDKDQSGDVDFEEFSKQRWPGLWVLFGVSMMVLAYCVGGLIGGKKAETLTLYKRDGQWSVCISEISWGRVTTNSTTFSLRKDTLARVGQQAGRKITAYAVYLFVDGELLADGSRPEVRIWAGNKQRAEFVCKSINRFFHGPTGKRGWKSVLGTMKEGGDKRGGASGSASGAQAQLGKQTGLVRFGSPTLWKSQAPASNAADATAVADAAMRDWAVRDWAGHAPLLRAENEDVRLALLRVQLEQLELPALRKRALAWGLSSELKVAEDAVALANALLSGPQEATRQLQESLQTVQSLLGRSIHHTTAGERENLSCVVQEMLRDIGSPDHGVVGAISSMKRMAFGEVFTFAESMAAVRQADQRLEVSDDASRPLCNVRARDYCPTCSASFSTMKKLVRELELCIHWQRGEGFPLARVDPWIVSGHCRNPQLRALLRSEMEPAELGPEWAADRRSAADQEHTTEAKMEKAEEDAVAEAIESAYELFDRYRVDTDGSERLTAEGVELLCRDPTLFRIFVPGGGRFTDMSPMQQHKMLSGLTSRVNDDGQLGLAEFEGWFEQEARIAFKDRARQRLEERQKSRQASQRIVTALSTRGKDWGLEEEIDCTLNALEFGRSLLTWGAGDTYAEEHMFKLLSHVQSVLGSVARRAAKISPNGLLMTTADQQAFQQLAEQARAYIDRTYALEQNIQFAHGDTGIMAALEAMDSRDVFMVSYRASVAAKLMDANQAVADRTDMENCCKHVGRLLDALEACMSWQGARGPVGSATLTSAPPGHLTHPALRDKLDGDESPWEWNDRWFTFPFQTEPAVVLLLLKSSQASTGVHFTSNLQLNVETDEAALNDGSMGSLVKMLLKRKTAVASEGQSKQGRSRQATALGSVDHSLLIAHKPSKREEELQVSAKRAGGNTGGDTTALERASEVSAALAIAVQNADDFKLGEEGHKILAFLQDQNIVHDTIVRNEGALAYGAKRSLDGVTPKEHKARRLRFVRYIKTAQSVFHPQSGVHGMRLPDHMSAFVDPTINTLPESGSDSMSETGSLIRSTTSRRAENLETSRRNYVMEGESASYRYEDAFMQIEPGLFNLPALSAYIRLAEKYARRTDETLAANELISSSEAQSEINGVRYRDMVDHIRWMYEDGGKELPLPNGVELGDDDLQPWHKHSDSIHDSAKAVDTTLVNLQNSILQNIRELHSIQERWDAKQAAAQKAEEVRRTMHSVQVSSMAHVAGNRWLKALSSRQPRDGTARGVETVINQQPAPQPEPEPEPALDTRTTEDAGGELLSSDDAPSRSRTPPRKPLRDNSDTAQSSAASRAKTPPRRRRSTQSAGVASSIDAQLQVNAAATDVEGSGLEDSKIKHDSETKPSAGKKAVSAGARRAAALSVMKAKKAKKQAASDSSVAGPETPNPPVDLAVPPTAPKSVKEKAAAMREAKRVGAASVAKAKAQAATEVCTDAAGAETTKTAVDAPDGLPVPSTAPKSAKEKAAAMREAKRAAIVKLAKQPDVTVEKGTDRAAVSTAVPSDDNATMGRKSTSTEAKRAAIMALRAQKQQQRQKAQAAKLEGTG